MCRYWLRSTRFSFHIVKHFDFDDPNMYDRVVKNSNVVINLIGSRHQTKEKKEQLARESVTYNYKKEAQFVDLFGTYFEAIGIDPVAKKAKALP